MSASCPKITDWLVADSFCADSFPALFPTISSPSETTQRRVRSRDSGRGYLKGPRTERSGNSWSGVVFGDISDIRALHPFARTEVLEAAKTAQEDLAQGIAWLRQLACLVIPCFTAWPKGTLYLHYWDIPVVWDMGTSVSWPGLPCRSLRLSREGSAGFRLEPSWLCKKMTCFMILLTPALQKPDIGFAMEAPDASGWLNRTFWDSGTWCKLVDHYLAARRGIIASRPFGVPLSLSLYLWICLCV